MELMTMKIDTTDTEWSPTVPNVHEIDGRSAAERSMRATLRKLGAARDEEDPLSAARGIVVSLAITFCGVAMMVLARCA
jgi:hypothetical protein